MEDKQIFSSKSTASAQAAVHLAEVSCIAARQTYRSLHLLKLNNSGCPNSGDTVEKVDVLDGLTIA